MKKYVLFVWMVGIACQLDLSANGGPIDGSIVSRTGDPYPLRTQAVSLISEKLEMSVVDDYTHVHVTYRLHNTSKQTANKIHYGFPVEYVGMDCCDTILTKEYIQSIEFLCNGKRLPLTGSSITVIDEEDNRNEEDDMDDEYYYFRKRKWFYTEFSIPANDLITLEVHYVVKNHFEDWATSKSWFTHYDERRLTYDFSPASYWGEGIVKDFQVIIQSEDPMNVSGLSFEKNGNEYRYSQLNFDLNTASPLEISYDVSSKQLNSERIKKQWIQSIKASSTLTGYSVQNLLDANMATAWVEGKSGSGIGEWIEIVLKDHVAVGAIILINGYTKSSKTYYENNRVKKMRVQVEGRYDEYEEYAHANEIELEDLPYQAIGIHSFAPMSSTLFDGGDGGYLTKKIRLTITEVYKGSAYDDTCLSELFLLGSLRDNH